MRQFQPGYLQKHKNPESLESTIDRACFTAIFTGLKDVVGYILKEELI